MSANQPRDNNSENSSAFFQFQTLANGYLSLLQKVVLTLALLLIFNWIFNNPDSVKKWLDSITKAQAFGITLERDVIAKTEQSLKTLLEESKSSSGYSANVIEDYMEAAITRAIHSYPAIKDANVIWVSEEPGSSNIKKMIHILELLDINVSIFKHFDTALDYVKNNSVHLIVTDVWLGKDIIGNTALKKCHVHYFEFPDKKIEREYNGSLVRFNADQNNVKVPGGYHLAELIELEFYRNEGAKPKLIFFSYKNTKVSRSFCGSGSYDRFDLLLQAIISQLEEKRWNKLK